MNLKTLAGTAALGLATTGLIALPTAPAFADDDRKTRSGSCSQGAKYTYTLAERDDDRLRAVLAVNSNKKNRAWTVRVLRGNQQVHQATKRTGPKGNVRFAKTFRSDDDRKITVIARSGYGETCKRALRLDG